MKHPHARRASQETAARLPAAYYKPIGEFRHAVRQFLAFSDEGARGHGLTSQQHQAMLAIKSHDGAEPLSVSELAERLMIKTHSAVGLVRRLVERGLVARQVSPQDRRRVLLTLEPAGEAALEAITLANLEQLNGLAQILSGLLKTVRRMEREAGRPEA